MPRKLKTFVTDSGFFQLAVAAPSMKAALEAWDISQDLFAQGFAKQTTDPKIIAVAEAAPGEVLRRPVGAAGAFAKHADLPAAPRGARKKKPMPKIDQAALRQATDALEEAKLAHARTVAALEDEQKDVTRRLTAEKARWAEALRNHKAAVTAAGKPR